MNKVYNVLVLGQQKKIENIPYGGGVGGCFLTRGKIGHLDFSMRYHGNGSLQLI